MKYLDIKDFILSNLSNLGLSIFGGHSFSDQIRLEECPYCHNGENKNPRAYIYIDEAKNQARFHCYNNDCESQGIYQLIEFCNPSLIPEFLNFKNGHEDKINLFSTNKKKELFKTYLEYTPLQIKESRFSRIIPKEAIKVLKSRNVYPFMDKNLIRWDKLTKRLAFMFIDKEEGETYYYQSMTIPKIKEYPEKYYYPSNKVQTYKNKRLFNFLNVDEKKPIIVCEGIIDSFFLDNSISLGGISNKSINNINTLKEKFGKENIYMIQDFDKAGKSYASVLIDKGIKVFQWKKFFKHHGISNYQSVDKIDINDLFTKYNFKEKIKFNDIEQFFGNKESSKLFL